MSKKLNLHILAPEKEFFNGEVNEVLVGSSVGPLGILPMHVNMITSLTPFTTEYMVDGKKTRVFTSSGILKVQNNEVIILCDACERPEEIDVKRAEESKNRAEERLQQCDSKLDKERAKKSLSRAVRRIKTSKNQ